ncbi:MAG: NfeD family protein [Muribaculaceae bacterium]|nr:NfeD family protein [Muribaculaceae bacterium]
MNGWIIWLTVAAVLLILEVLTQTMWLLCMAIGCTGALIAALCGASTVWQVTALAGSSVLAYLLIMPWFRKLHIAATAKESRNARTGMDALLGRHAIITHEIKPGQPGRARIDGDNWQVTAPGHTQIIPRGQEVVVTGYNSIILEVAVI